MLVVIIIGAFASIAFGLTLVSTHGNVRTGLIIAFGLAMVICALKAESVDYLWSVRHGDPDEWESIKFALGFALIELALALVLPTFKCVFLAGVWTTRWLTRFARKHTHHYSA